MPLPTPNAGESEKDFMARCIPGVRDEFEGDQATAVCARQWEQKDRQARAMPAEPHWLKATAPRAQVQGVDREARVLRGYVVAQQGVFKDRRGEFNADGLKQITRQINEKAKGLKSRFGHPTLSSDGVGTFLGRARAAHLGTALDERTGRRVPAVRADLHFSDTAFKTPQHGDLAGYVMELAESDPDALSSSLVIEPDEVAQLDGKGRHLVGEDGEPVPALWFPKRLHASDIVDTGDAVDGLLSAGVDVDRLPDALQRRGAEALDRLFAGQPREVVEARCGAWLQRYLNERFGVPAAQVKQVEELAAMGGRFYALGQDSWCDTTADSWRMVPGKGFVRHEGGKPAAVVGTPKLDAKRLKLDEMALVLRKLGGK